MYRKTTGNITVSVKPLYLENQSNPANDDYIWAYHVRIENHGDLPVTLTHRLWQIIDANGIMQEMQGIGVVGEQPVIPAGGVFEYTSGTPLKTPSGIMVGRYAMAADDGHAFDVPVPAFSLDSPYQAMQLH